ncbi:MAG: ComEC/Rec2 family competence protein [Spirochaetia bacterium]|jgi:competence protein ComEC
MLRRHITPALLAFCVMLACCCLNRLLVGRETLLVCAAAASSAAGIVLFHTAPEGARRAGILLLSIACGCLLGFWSLARMTREPQAASLPFPEKEVSGFTGVLLQDSVLATTGDTLLRLSLKDASSQRLSVMASARGQALVRVHGDYRFSLGQELELKAGLSRLDAATGETWTATVERKDLLRRGYSSSLWSMRGAARDWLHKAVSRAGYPASALMEALLIGSREDVPPDLYDGFRKTGSLHILALSGLHVSVIYALLLGMLGFLQGRALKLLIATLVLIFYQVLAGFMPSLLRATITIILAGIGLLLDRDAEPLNLLSLSGIAVLLASPWEAFSLSFQLSYLALAGILAVGPVIQRPLEGRIPRIILAPLAMSVGAQIATFPLVAARFGVYYPSGLLAGLILVPLTTAVLWGGLGWLAVFVVPWPFLHDLGAQGFSILYRLIQETAATFGSLPGVSISPQVLPWAVSFSIVFTACLALFFPLRPHARPGLQ